MIKVDNVLWERKSLIDLNHQMIVRLDPPQVKQLKVPHLPKYLQTNTLAYFETPPATAKTVLLTSTPGWRPPIGWPSCRRRG